MIDSGRSKQDTDQEYLTHTFYVLKYWTDKSSLRDKQWILTWFYTIYPIHASIYLNKDGYVALN